MCNGQLPRETLTFGRATALTAFGVCLAFIAGAAVAGEPLQVTADSTTVRICAGNQLLVGYRYADVPFKPYVEQFCSPAGVNVLRDSPHDHKHHHGLMFAVAVNGVDFWIEVDRAGRQAHRRLGDVCIDGQGGLNRAAFTEDLDWIHPGDQKVLIQEQRTIGVYQAEDLRASLLAWQGRFTLPRGASPATLTGSPYFGLGMRFVQSMDSDGRFLNADGKAGVEGTNNARSKWCAYAAQAEGKPVTVAMFDHPGNLRHPAVWFTMDSPFAYLSATTNLSKEPFTVTGNKPLLLRWAVGLWDGTADASRIDKLYRRWIGLPVNRAAHPLQLSDKQPGGQVPTCDGAEVNGRRWSGS